MALSTPIMIFSFHSNKLRVRVIVSAGSQHKCKFTRVAIKLIYAVLTVTYCGCIKNFTVTRSVTSGKKKGQRTPFFPKSPLEKYVFDLLPTIHTRSPPARPLHVYVNLSPDPIPLLLYTVLITTFSSECNIYNYSI